MEQLTQSDEEIQSDDELQELFAAGRLKPGLNIPFEKKIYVNNVMGMKKKLAEFESSLPWQERLDIINQPAPLAPELSVEVDEQAQLVKAAVTNEYALNEFKRETLFHRQAQAAVLEGMARLKSLGIPTLRPEDYFAEMMKSDDHMQKVRKSLLQKQAGMERSEKMKKMRSERKMAKQKQIEVTLRKQKEKKEFSEEIKKYRKGMRNNLDFLETKPTSNQRKKSDSHPKKRVSKKRQVKNEKFGFGGRKRGTKNNQHSKARKNKPARPGKSRRASQKNKK